MSVTRSFLDDMHSLSRSEFSLETRAAVRIRLLDYLGVTLAGSTMLKDKVRRLASNSVGQVPLLGSHLRTDLFNAALISGLCSHVAELDDGDRFGMVHPGSPIISALLGTTIIDGWDWQRLERAVVVGYESSIRIARTVQPALKKKGLHATGVCGSIGAALGFAAAFDKDIEGFDAALSAAATTASGMLKVIRGRSELKPYNSGSAAQSGLAAAQMAAAGFPGPGDVLDGLDGLLSLIGEGAYETVTGANASGLPCIETVYVKPYASCRHCHAPVEAALDILKNENFDVEAIERIDIATHRLAVHLHDHQDIEGVNSGKMSIPYSVAAAIVCGHGGMSCFGPEQVRDVATLRLTRKIHVREDPAMTAEVPAKRAAKIDIVLGSGEILTRRIDLPLGEPETPLSAADLRAKFIDLALFAEVGNERANNIADLALDLETPLPILFEALGLVR